MTDRKLRARGRRRLLATGGALALGGLAGCAGDMESNSNAETTNSPSLGDHPAAKGLDEQPRLGPPPTDAEGVVVAFEDPSCPRCAAFETGTVPELRERLGDRVSFVLRTYPVVYPWGKPATQAVEAAFAREMDTATTGEETPTSAETTTPESEPYGVRQGSVDTWALVRHYFEDQGEFDEGNVLEKTRTFLADETDLDAEAVVADAEAEAYDDAVQADLSAGEAANVGRTTPTVYLFRDGEFRTSAKGSISYQVIESALGV
jgi:protein-disulfide isomerase